MTFFEKLQEIIKVDLKLDLHIHHLINFNFIRNDYAPPISYQEPKKLVIINFEKLLPPQQDEIKRLIQPLVNDEDKLLLNEKSKETIESVDNEERSTDEKALLEFYKDKIPENDYFALRSSLHLRKRFRAGASRDEIYIMRTQIIKSFPERGENISKLCSSGYFENQIRIVYNVMSCRPGFKKEDFVKVFHLFIEEGAFAVFVSERMTPDDIKSAIEKERTIQVRYGVPEPSVLVHAIGRNNIENANMAFYDLKEKYTHLSVERSDDMNIFFASVKFN
jgi:hypothetical protein